MKFNNSNIAVADDAGFGRKTLKGLAKIFAFSFLFFSFPVFLNASQVSPEGVLKDIIFGFISGL